MTGNGDRNTSPWLPDFKLETAPSGALYVILTPDLIGQRQTAKTVTLGYNIIESAHILHRRT